MKKISLILLLLLSLSAHGQIIVSITDNNQIERIQTTEEKSLQIKLTNDSTLDLSLAWPYCIDGEDLDVLPSEGLFGQIRYKFDCENRVVLFWPKNETKQNSDTATKVYICPDAFQIKECESEEEKQKTNPGDQYTDITQIPFPVFKYAQEANTLNSISSEERILIINGNPNLFQRKSFASIYKYDTTSENNLKITKNSIPVNGNLTVFIKDYSTIGKITIEAEKYNYSYSEDLSSLIDMVQSNPKSEEETNQNTEPTSILIQYTDDTTRYLNAVLSSLEDVQFLNISDLYILKTYVEKIEAVVRNQNILLSPEQVSLLSAIKCWRPEYLRITPIPIDPEDEFDEISLKATLVDIHRNKEDEYQLGPYRGKGGWGIDVGAMLFVTNLKNNEVYTDSINISEDSKELQAIIDSTNQLSIGLGANAEMYFRTGSYINPSINIGLFVPFDEDISPFLSLGPGLSIANRNVKLTLSAGMALGKINSIKERYQGNDLGRFQNLTNENLVEKTWQKGWYVGVGLKYNLSQKK